MAVLAKTGAETGISANTVRKVLRSKVDFSTTGKKRTRLQSVMFGQIEDFEAAKKKVDMLGCEGRTLQPPPPSPPPHHRPTDSPNKISTHHTLCDVSAKPIKVELSVG